MTKLFVSIFILMASLSVYSDILSLDREQKKVLYYKLYKKGFYGCQEILLIKEDPLIDGLYRISCDFGDDIYDIAWWKGKKDGKIVEKFKLDCSSFYDLKSCWDMEKRIEFHRKNNRERK